MKINKIFIWLLIIVFTTSIALIGIGCKEEASTTEETVEADEVTEVEEAEEAEEETVEEEAVDLEPVTIVFTNWHSNFEEQWLKTLDLFMETYPHITVDLAQLPPGEYNQLLYADMELGVGPDVYHVFGGDGGREYYDAGFLLTFDEEMIPNLANFPESMLAAVEVEGGYRGVPAYANPFGAVYNKEIFDKYNLEEPETWEEFLAVCQTLLDNGITPLDIGTAWTNHVGGIYFPAIGSSFYGGEEGRLKLVAGELLMTDKPFVDAFEALLQLRPFMPDNFQDLDFTGRANTFLAQETAISIHGMWLLNYLAASEITFEIGFFPMPAAEGYDQWMEFFVMNHHVVNPATEELEASLTLLNWLASKEWAQEHLDNGAQGTPSIPGDFNIGNPVLKEALSYVTEIPTTYNMSQGGLNSGDPSIDIALNEAAIGLWTGKFTPEEAAQHVHDSLAIWYEPWQ